MGWQGKAMTMKADQVALHDLDHHWGQAYDIALTGAGWVAKRLDNGRALVASGPEGLRDLIVADYDAEPVTGDLPPCLPLEWIRP
jgi:hypothetical protein